ncbi:MAG: bifunctional ADP-heptose synthase [Cytophagales bacterium]|nr:bifunctional ADP-heptose synthase [Cytophagales bacterium]MDW8384112.1 bifunctional ADP-heptose synthase [Flammeovirgaceae bacterium]
MKKRSFESVFQSFERLRVLVIGDVMVDAYVWGNVTRISPEAPVPVVNVKKREKRLGGASNVALNVKALGAQVTICSVIGEDAYDVGLIELLKNHCISDKGILISKERVTTIKERIIAGSQHVVRVDSEIDTPISEKETFQLLEKIQKLISDTDVIIFEDYDKGVITPSLIKEVVKEANLKNVPTAVDPKKRNFWAYHGVTLFKPNLKELREGIKTEISAENIDEIKRAVHVLKENMNVQIALVTLSEQGVFISNSKEEHYIPAHLRQIADVSGAGDTVISIAALCLAEKLPLKYIAGIANLGGGLVCEKPGVVPVDKRQLLSETIRVYGKEIASEVL